jgi:hypothetical protein
MDSEKLYEKKAKDKLDLDIESIRSFTPVDLPYCVGCSKDLPITESGLTKENLKIYCDRITKYKIDSNHFCGGFISTDAYCICYDYSILKNINEIQIQTFEALPNIFISSIESPKPKNSTNFDKIFSRRMTNITSTFTEAREGVNRLVKFFRKNLVDNSWGVYPNRLTGESYDLFLHGHQLDKILRGKLGSPVELQSGRNIVERVVYLAIMGHYHKLGLMSAEKTKDGVLLLGSLVYPSYEHKDEFLSHMGDVVVDFNGKNHVIQINRFKIIEKERIRQIERNEKCPPSLAEKLSNFRERLQITDIVLPGNHDPFNSIWLKNKKFEGIPNVALGDYIDFSEVEKDEGAREMIKIFKEYGTELKFQGVPTS